VDPDDGSRAAGPLDRLALSATLHCLTGCSIGELLGMVLGTWLHWGNLETIAAAVALAFLFGYAFTIRPLLGSGMALAAALKLALAADTLSIAVMEIVDNGLMLLIPGAMDAHLGEPRFWLSMAVSLAVAGAAAFPVNRWLIGRGEGHAHVHRHHGAGHGPPERTAPAPARERDPGDPPRAHPH
jgi:hypothetical protein